MRAKIRFAVRLVVQTAIAVFVPGGLVLIALHHLHRRRKMKAELAAEATIHAP